MLLLAIPLLTVGVAAASGGGATPSSAARVPPVVSGLGADEQVAWSPDGRRIAYIDRNLAAAQPGLYIVNADGSRSLHVFGGDDATLARWSPDSRRIAWWGYSIRSPLAIWALSGESLGVEGDAGPRFSWSPDGKWLAYERRTDLPHTCGGGYSVLVARAEGTGRRQLVTGLTGDPEWAPDGSEIAYTRYQPGHSCTNEIKAVRPNGGAERTFRRGQEYDIVPHWSPAGDFLAYGNGYHTYVASRDGSGERAVDAGNWLSWLHLVWSPNDDWLASHGDAGSGLVLVNVRGRAPVVFRDASESFSWSPSGDEILFSRFGVVTIGRLDGSAAALVPGQAADWSPDGRRIAFLRQAYRGGESFSHCWWQLYVADVSGANARPVSRCRIEGTKGPDSIPGTPGPDMIFGLAGNDVLRSGPGADTVVGGSGADAIASGGGSDTVDVRSRERDKVSCGPGRDLVIADLKDRVRRDCEVVRRRRDRSVE